MKKQILLLLTLLLFLSGCGQTVTYLPTAEPEEIAVNQKGGTYQAETDSQFFWGIDGNQFLLPAALISKGNSGYYYFDDLSNLLCFYDLETGDSYPLCSRPNCSHDNADCEAYWDNYNVFEIQYVNNALYILGNMDEDFNTVLLMRVKPDGSNREMFYEVFNAEDPGPTNALIHRGYLYYTINPYLNDMSTLDGTILYRRRLDGQADAEEIYKSSACYGSMIQLQAYGDYVYVQEGGYTDEAGTTYTGNIGRISIHSLEYDVLAVGMYRSYTVGGSMLYYDNGTQIVALETDTGRETVLYESGMPVYLGFDGTNLWLDNDCGIFVFKETAADAQRTLTVLSTDGTVLQELPLETEDGNYIYLMFGDGEALFAEIDRIRSDGYYDTSICAADKSDILNGTLAWSELYGS